MGYYSNKTREIIGSVAGITSGINGIFQKKQSVDLAYQLENDKKRYQSYVNAAEQDPAEFEDIKAEFESFAAENSETAKNQFSHPKVRELYEQQSLQLANSYSQQFATIQTNHMVQDGRVKEKALLDDLVKNVPYDQGAYDAFVEDLNRKAKGAQFYTRSESELMAKQYSEIALNNAVSAGALDTFNRTEGDYTQKTDAALDWLYSNEGAKSLGGISADQLKKVDTEINLLANREYTRQQREWNEYDEGKDRELAQSLIDGNLSINLIDAADFYDGDRTLKWLNIAEGMVKDEGKTELSPADYARLNILATDRTKDERWKVNQATLLLAENGYTDSKVLKAGIDYVTSLGKDYQNPVFQMSLDNLNNGFDAIIKDGKDWGGIDAENLAVEKQKRVDMLLGYYRSGQYSPEQMMEVSNNLLSDWTRREISKQLEQTVNFNLSNFSPSTLRSVQNFPEMMELSEAGKYLGIRQSDIADLHQFETLYDQAMSKTDIPGLEKQSGLYRDDVKPVYTSMIDGIKREIKMMKDGTFQYWVQAEPGSPDGEWREMDYRYVDPTTGQQSIPSVISDGNVSLEGQAQPDTTVSGPFYISHGSSSMSGLREPEMTMGSLPPGVYIPEYEDDSKKFTPELQEAIAQKIADGRLSWFEKRELRKTYDLSRETLNAFVERVEESLELANK